MGLKEKALKVQKDLADPDSETSEGAALAEPEAVSYGLEKLGPEGAELSQLPHLEEITKSDSFLHSEDLHSSSRPVIHGLAQQSQIEALLNLVELAKELNSVKTEEELWDAIIFTLMGQLGVREIAIFLKIDAHFILKANKGFVAKAGFSLSFDSSLVKKLSQDTGLIYLKKLIPHLKSLEKVWFNSLNADLLIPISHYETNVGFIILGKPMALLEYNLEDLMYLKILGELIGSYYESIQQLIKMSERKRIWDERDTGYKGMKRYMELMERAVNFDQVDEALLEALDYHYEVKKFIFLLREGKQLLPNLHKNLDDKTIKKFQVSTHEPWIIEMKGHNGWYEYVEHKEDSKFTKKFSSEELSVIDHVFTLPLYFANEIEGVFLIFEIEKNMTLDNLKYLDMIINSYYWAFMAYKSKAGDVKNLEEPLYALRTLINDYEIDLKTREIPYSLMSITIENSTRLIRLKGNQFFGNQKAYLKSMLISMSAEKDSCIEIFSGSFLIILRGKGKEDCEHVLVRLKEAVKLKYKAENLRPLLKSKILSRPSEPAVSIDIFLFD